MYNLGTVFIYNFEWFTFITSSRVEYDAVSIV